MIEMALFGNDSAHDAARHRLREAWTFERADRGKVVAQIPDAGVSLTAWAGGQHAVVAIVCTDIVSSTRAKQNSNNQKMREIELAHITQSRHLSSTFGGHLVKSYGDGALLIFNDVEIALEYANALQNEPGHSSLSGCIRIAIHFGPVNVTDDDIAGISVNLAARASAASSAADIILTNQARMCLITSTAQHHRDLVWKLLPDANGSSGATKLWSIAARRTHTDWNTSLVNVGSNLTEAANAAITPFDYCSIGTVTEAQATETAEVVYSNLLLGLSGGSTSDRRRLPPGIEGTYAQVGSPPLGIFVIQTDPPPMDASLDELIAHQKRVVHEMEHACSRERDKLRKFVSQLENTTSAPGQVQKVIRLS